MYLYADLSTDRLKRPHTIEDLFFYKYIFLIERTHAHSCLHLFCEWKSSIEKHETLGTAHLEMDYYHQKMKYLAWPSRLDDHSNRNEMRKQSIVVGRLDSPSSSVFVVYLFIYLLSTQCIHRRFMCVCFVCCAIE